MTQLTTQSSGVTTWNTKAGKEVRSHTATGALRAPAIVKTAAAQSNDLQQWRNGQYAPILRELRELVPVSAQGFIPTHGDKVTVLSLLRSVSDVALKPTVDKSTGIVRERKGHKARMFALIETIMAYESERSALKDAQMDNAPIANTGPCEFYAVGDLSAPQ